MKDYDKQLEKMKDDVCTDIESELKRIGKTFDVQEAAEDGEIEFFTYPVIDELDIVKIYPDGTVEWFAVSDDEPRTFRGMVEEDMITISDAIGFLNDLRDYEKQ